MPRPRNQEDHLRQRLAGNLSVISAFLVLVSCGGGGSPTAPTPTSITINSTGALLFVGQTETFTATVTFSNGTTQVLTGGTWGSDAPAVATVNAASGLVTTVAPGLVSIFVDGQGLRGTKQITVSPSYAGFWNGQYSVTACTQTGDFAVAPLAFCGSLIVVGVTTPPVAFNLSQTGTTISGQTFLGTLGSTPFTTVAGPTGALSFQALYVEDTFRIAQAWNLNISAQNQLAGTVVQTWTDATLTGQMVVSGTMLNVVKSSADQARDVRPNVKPRSWADIAAAISGR